MTSITIVGRITDTPDLKFTPAGAAVANFTVAVNHRRKNGDQWEDDGTTYYRCAGWKNLAENIAAQLTKGQLVIVYGSLRTREFDRNDGGKGLSLDLTVNDIGPAITKAPQAVPRGQGAGWGTPAPQATTQPQGGASWDAQPPF